PRDFCTLPFGAQRTTLHLCGRLDRSCFSFCCARDPRDLPSFPTRRSSDLTLPSSQTIGGAGATHAPVTGSQASAVQAFPSSQRRSEEHTSELQSRVDLVCRLLLEKKKHKTTKNNSEYTAAHTAPTCAARTA